MATEKSIKPANLVPRSFGGEKNNFSDDLIANGYEVNMPQTYNGDNLNYQLDATGKELDYCEKVVDYINGLGVGKTPIVNANNKLDETQVGLKVYNATETYSLGEWVRSGDKIYQSLTQGNVGNDLTNETYWKEVRLGGGSGLELCDIGMALYVDETKGLRRYLNGQIVDINTNTQAFLNRLLEIKNTNPDYFTTEDNWQAEALLNIDGCVYKFVLNYSGDNVVSVRLPKYPDYVEINAGGTLPVVGNGISLGLTNKTLNFGIYAYSGTNVIVSTGYYGANVGTRPSQGSTSSAVVLGVTTNPTKSGIQTTLNQTKLKMRYFIQIATGSETENNIINEIELNNPYSLFDSKYSDHELNNLSWLKSEGQWNAKAVYTNAYDKLLKVYNGTETVVGLSVKLSTETYTDYDFVLNTTDETFRLPLLDGSENILSNKRINYDLPTESGQTYTAQYNGSVQFNATTTSASQYIRLYNQTSGQIAEQRPPANNVGSVSYIAVKKGDVFKITGDVISTVKSLYLIKAQGNGSLYFYVGETVQNANLIDAGRIEEQVANCITRNDCKAYVTETYQNGTSWYRIYSDGWCEQGSKIKSSSATLTVSLLKTYYSNNYNIQILPNTNNGTVNCSVKGIPSTSSFTLTSSETPNNGFYWQTCGYIA